MRLPWERRKLANVPLASVPRVYHPRPPSPPRRKSTPTGVCMDNDVSSFSIAPSCGEPRLCIRAPSPRRTSTPVGMFNQSDMMSYPIVAPRHTPCRIDPPPVAPVVVEPPAPAPGTRAAKILSFVKTHFKK